MNLHEAFLLRFGAITNAKRLIKEGADVNLKDENSNAPIHIAVQDNDFSFVKLLLKKGANVNEVDGVNETPLHIASHKGHSEIARFLVENGANVDIKNSVLETPLHIASQEGELNVICELLRFDACSTSKDASGFDPLEYALYRNDEIITKVIAFRRHMN